MTCHFSLRHVPENGWFSDAPTGLRQGQIRCKFHYILDDFENASPNFSLFLQTVNAIEKLFAGFNVQPRIGMNQSLI